MFKTNLRAWAALAVTAALFAMTGQTCLPPPPSDDLAVTATATPASGVNSVAVTLTAVATNGTAPLTYAWTASPTTTITDTDPADGNASATVTATTTFTCTVTDSATPVATATDTATVTVTQAISVVASGPAAALGGTTANLLATPSNYSGAVSFSWLMTANGTAGSATVVGATSQTPAVSFSADAAGTFTFQVTATDSAGTAADTVDIAVTATGAGASTTFTNGTDTLTGTTGADIFDGAMYYNATANAWLMTVNTADQADGLAGADVADIELDEGITVNPTLANIETVNILVTNNVDGGAAAATFNASRTTGMTDLGVTNSVAALTVSNLQAVPAVASTDMAANLTLTFAAAAVSGSTDTLAITLDGATAGILTIPETLESMTIASGGSVANVLDDIVDATSADDATGVADITITGDQDLSLAAAAALDGSVDTIDASALTGGLTAIFGDAISNAITFTGGSGDDVVTAGTAADAVAADMGAGDDTLTLGAFTDGTDDVDGGAGTDTLSMDTASAGAIASAATTIANFEVLSISDGLADDLTLAYFGVSNVVLAAGINGAQTLTVVSGSEVAIEAADAGANALGITVGGTGTSDSVTLTLEPAAGATEVGGLTTLTGVESLTIASLGAANTLTSVTFAPSAGVSAATVTITGTKNLVLGTVTAGTPISATALTGTLSLTLGQAGAATGGSGVNTLTGSASADSLAGGAAADVLSGLAGADAISGAAGADSITGGTGMDVMTGGAGADTFKFVAADGGGAPSATVYDTITDFTKSEDIIDFTAGALVIVTYTPAASATAAISAEGIATFHADDSTLALRIVAAEAGINASGAAAARQFCVFEFSGDTYMFVSDGVDGVDANDVLITMDGVTGVTGTTLTAGDVELD